ncbi:MAG: DUF4350 domain-containing protein [Planctomycetota bacterium]
MTRVIIALLICAAIALGVWMFYDAAYTASRGGVDLPIYSARRHDPYGSAALRDLLAELDVPVHTLDRPRLRDDERGVLLQVLPIDRADLEWRVPGGAPAYGIATDHLRAWIARGNTVVQFTRGQTGLMASFDLTVAEDPGGRLMAAAIEQHQVHGAFPSSMPGAPCSVEWTARGRERAGTGGEEPDLMLWRSPRAFDLGPDTAWRVLATFDGRPVAAELRHGNGRFVAVGSPGPVLNHGIGRGGNLEFVLGLVGDGPVYLDEWSHGIGNAGTLVGLMREFGLMPALLQLLVVLAFYVWSVRGQHPPDVEPPARARARSEQVDVLGNLYERVLTPAQTRERARDEVVRRVAAALGCSVGDVERGKISPGPDTGRRLNEIVQTLRRLSQAQSEKRDRADVARALTLSSQFLEESSHVRTPS